MKMTTEKYIEFFRAGGLSDDQILGKAVGEVKAAIKTGPMLLTAENISSYPLLVLSDSEYEEFKVLWPEIEKELREKVTTEAKVLAEDDDSSKA